MGGHGMSGYGRSGPPPPSSSMVNQQQPMPAQQPHHQPPMQHQPSSQQHPAMNQHGQQPHMGQQPVGQHMPQPPSHPSAMQPGMGSAHQPSQGHQMPQHAASPQGPVQQQRRPPEALAARLLPVTPVVSRDQYGALACSLGFFHPCLEDTRTRQHPSQPHTSQTQSQHLGQHPSQHPVPHPASHPAQHPSQHSNQAQQPQQPAQQQQQQHSSPPPVSSPPSGPGTPQQQGPSPPSQQHHPPYGSQDEESELAKTWSKLESFVVAEPQSMCIDDFVGGSLNPPNRSSPTPNQSPAPPSSLSTQSYAQHSAHGQQDLMGAIHLLEYSWCQVEETTVQNCFKRAGFNVCAGDGDDASNTVDQTSDIVDQACETLLAEVLERQGVREGISFPDFRDIDSEV
ncbi:hypothetical protein HPB50_007875 [Hyalomma asiaticum]|uniref:Uncharacterized protein n=1 Tax=Hyalomma asiaticum TaxID=266040 RepID=A0ACB7TGT2_HYAAI|nr:hypothetical protein HPB50_007875 [Hyalomma asiaticum]